MSEDDVKRGETVVRRTKIDTEAGQAEVIRTVKPNAQTDTKTRVHWTFDFADVTEEEVMELAVRTLVIDAQRAWRNMSAADRSKNAERTIRVREMLDAAKTRGTGDPVKRAASLASKMTDEEREELLRLLQEGKK